jgi:hypothetical protein
MRHELSIAALLWVGAVPASAAIPVTDSANETQEKKISDCMQKARVYKQQTLTPAQGITKSVKTPGSAAGSIPQVGTADVTGQGASGATGYVSGIDFTSLAPAQIGSSALTPGSISLITVAQAVQALSNVSGAISGNKTGQLAAAAAAGVLSLIQGAWDQNSSSRLNNIAQWNQVLMGVSTTAGFFNLRSINALTGASNAAAFMTFSPEKATLVTPMQ